MPKDLPPEREGERGYEQPAPPRPPAPPEPDRNETGKKAYVEHLDVTRDELEEIREQERVEGITEERRGTPAAPSDRPENEPPHPMDVNEFDQVRRPRGLPPHER